MTNTPPGNLHIRALSLRKHGKTLADVRNLTLQTGAIHLLVGCNGAGKTSLLRTLHGLEAEQGHVDSPSLNELRQAFVFQKPVFLRDTVRANLRLALRAHQGIRQPAWGTDDSLRDLLHRVQLPGLLDRQAHSLSGGEQQRLALARALLMQPDLLLLDEPTSNLDTQATLAFENVLLDVRNAGCTLLMSSHSMTQVRRLAQRLVFMAGGQIMETHDQPSAFFDAPQTEAARDFLGQL
jgi:tungstate transport system ATP-binding protein